MNAQKTIFICYARADEELKQKLEQHLRLLKRLGLVDIWHDRNISAGTEWQQEIDRHLNNAQIILLLISPDFMDSDYCYGVEMKRAMERHARGEACVIPVILRPVIWHSAPFGKLQALPRDAEPVTSRNWHTLDEAFFSIAKGIQDKIEEIQTEVSSAIIYRGEALNITAGVKAPIALAIEQHQDQLSGNFVWSPPLMGSGPLAGTVRPDGTIHFVVTAADGSTPFTNSRTVVFTGTIGPDGSLKGHYAVDNGQQGVWSVLPQ